MYTYNDLVAALQSGLSMEDIAAQMSKDLNAAKAEYDMRVAAEKKAHTEARKRELMKNFYLALGAYATEVHPDSTITEMFNEETPSDKDLDQLTEQIDGLFETFEALNGLSALFDTISPTQSSSPLGVKPANWHELVNKTVEVDPIEEFLNKNVRSK